MALPRRTATCHPDRPHCARGLCNSCYIVRRSQGKPLPPKRPRTIPKCHPDREHRAKGFCGSCYQLQKPSHRGPSAEYLRERHFRKKYGITIAERDAMAARQGGTCAICQAPDGKGKLRALHVDHCHETGEIRGLLCGDCNRGLGMFGDDVFRLKAAIQYLSK